MWVRVRVGVARVMAKSQESEPESESVRSPQWDLESQQHHHNSENLAAVRSRIQSRSRPWRGNEPEVGVRVRVGQRPGVGVGFGVRISPQRLRKPDQYTVNRVAKVRTFCQYFCPNLSHSLFEKTFFLKKIQKNTLLKIRWYVRPTGLVNLVVKILFSSIEVPLFNLYFFVTFPLS